MLRMAGFALAAACIAARADAQLGPGFVNQDMQRLGPASTTTVTLSHDASDRMTVPVMINGQGPFDFVVDTGADRTVLSTDLAARLGLSEGPAVLVRSTLDARTERSVVVANLTVGTRTVNDLHAPLLTRTAIGADGMLGIDALRNQAMVMDFRAHRMSMWPSETLPIDPGSIVVTGRNRYGQLILLDASVDGVPVFVILDSGAETSIVNSTFRRMMEDGLPASAGKHPALIVSVTGGTGSGQFGELTNLTLGDMTLRDLPVVFADLYTFRLFGLQNRPAMLLGMDALRIFARVEIDYPKRRVNFKLASAN